jgi:hypothetical protein
MLELLFHSFADELVKLADVPAKQRNKAEEHFVQEVKNWGAFEKNLKTKGFQKAIIEHPEADEKLKKYVKNFGGYLNSKDVVGKVSSRTGFKSYAIKKLPSGRLACGCPDWQYVRSVRGGDCWHVLELKAAQRSQP